MNKFPAVYRLSIMDEGTFIELISLNVCEEIHNNLLLSLDLMSFTDY